jgi:hypothetical protein
MKQTIGLSQFTDAFMSIRPKNFTYEGLEILFNGLEELEEDTNEEMELDVIALCCDFYEMSINEILQSYPDLFDEERLEDDDAYDYVRDVLAHHTWVLGVTDSNTFVYRQF